MSIELVNLLILIIVANASPIFIRLLLKSKFCYAVDSGKKFIDGNRVLGDSKTWRGLLAALCITPVVATWLGYTFLTGILVAAYAMLGDLAASFIKRRLGMRSSSMAPLLDQIPESLLPAVFLRLQFGLHWQSIVILIVLFVFLELILSAVFYKLGVRKQPY